MSLYRKYRPQTFASLLGQDHLREVIQNAVRQDKVSHAYLFTGPRGTGKTSTARLLARVINCTQVKQAEPCNSCEICREALGESLTDVIEIDAASHGLVEDARDLVERAKFLPIRARKKVYIIDEVHMLSKSAFNALLKIIEEPPYHVHFILATTEAHKVLDTIRSRCQHFDFHLASDDLIQMNLETVCEREGIHPQSDSLRLLAEQARGSFRDALSLLEQLIGIGDFTVVDVQQTLGLSQELVVRQFFDALLRGDHASALTLIQELHDQGSDLYQFCQAFLGCLRGQLLQGVFVVLPWIDHFYHALDQLRDPIIARLPLELAVMKCIPSTPAQVTHSPTPVAVMKECAPVRTVAHEPVSAVEKTKSVSQQSGEVAVFNPDSFLSLIQHVSLRSLIKHADLNFSEQELKITARNQFEMDKIRSKDNLSQLHEALKRLVGGEPTLSLEVADLAPAQAKGVSSGDISSVF
ncbi:MAG: DNA polymerase III subunit gamma/tau [bacterium]|nr:DNA polymerase III subunit gamma/tau [bacterium]